MVYLGLAPVLLPLELNRYFRQEKIFKQKSWNKQLFLTFIYLFIYFWLRWVFVAVRRLSLVAVSRGYSCLWCAGFSLQWLLLLWSTGSRHAGSVVVA